MDQRILNMSELFRGFLRVWIWAVEAPFWEFISKGNRGEQKLLYNRHIIMDDHTPEAS